MKLLRFTTLFAIICLLTTGCASTRANKGYVGKPGPWAYEPQIEIGDSNIVLDTLGNILGIPGKVVLLNHRINNHQFSEDTRRALESYIESNPDTMSETKIRVNQFAPIGEFKRLIDNKKISWWWRATIGIPTTLFSLAGKLIGGDHYNPYTDTVNIYSDVSSVAVHEAAHASDFTEKSERRGKLADWYAIGRVLPPVTLYQEYVASADAIEHFKEEGARDEEIEAYGTLIPAYGTYVGGTVGTPYAEYMGAATGHIVSIVPRYNRRRTYEAFDSVTWSEDVVDDNDIKNDVLAESLREDESKEEKLLDDAFLKSLQEHPISQFQETQTD